MKEFTSVPGYNRELVDPPRPSENFEQLVDPETLERLVLEGHINPLMAESGRITRIEKDPKNKLTKVYLSEEFSNEFFERMTPGYTFALNTVAGIFNRAGAIGITMGSSAYALDTMSKAVNIDDVDRNFSINDLPAVRSEIQKLIKSGNENNKSIIDSYSETKLDNGNTVRLQMWVTDPVSMERTEVEMFAQDTEDRDPATVERYPEINYLDIGISEHVVYVVDVPGKNVESLPFYARSSSVELYTKVLITEFLKLDFTEFSIDPSLKQKIVARLSKLQGLEINFANLRELALSNLPPGPESIAEKKEKVNVFISKIESVYEEFLSVISMNSNESIDPDGSDFTASMSDRADPIIDVLPGPGGRSSWEISHLRRTDQVEQAMILFERTNKVDIESIMRGYHDISDSAEFMYDSGYLKLITNDKNEKSYGVSTIPIESLAAEEKALLISKIINLRAVLEIVESDHHEMEERYRQYSNLIKQKDEFPAYVLINTMQNDFLARVGKTIEFYGTFLYELEEVSR